MDVCKALPSVAVDCSRRRRDIRLLVEACAAGMAGAGAALQGLAPLPRLSAHRQPVYPNTLAASSAHALHAFPRAGLILSNFELLNFR
jgi:hypothetical protein